MGEDLFLRVGWITGVLGLNKGTLPIGEGWVVVALAGASLLNTLWGIKTLLRYGRTDGFKSYGGGGSSKLKKLYAPKYVWGLFYA